ncbi:DNA-binding protein, partial [Achromatium sp. WMS1]
LLTWNCRHIANAIIRPSIERSCRTQGYEPPIICTPEELLRDDDVER